MIALTYSNTHFLTLNDKEEAESQREYIYEETNKMQFELNSK